LFPLLIAAHCFVWMLKVEPALLTALVLSLPAALKFDAQGKLKPCWNYLLADLNGYRPLRFQPHCLM
jgi:hypothetical protein